MNGSGPLDFDVIIRDTDFKKTFDAMERRVMGFTDKADRSISSLESTFTNLGRIAAGAFAFDQLADLPQKLIQVRGAFQQLETSYKTILGSKEKADALFKDVVKFAATTPFDLKGVAGASKMLLAYGFASESVIGTLRRLGDVSSGLDIPLGELTELYGKTKTNGRLFAEDLNQYVGRGIPLIQLLADQFKVADSEVRGLVESGKVGFPEVERALNKLTDAGGMFAGLTDENAKSLTGLYSNFEDAIDQALNGIGKSQEGILSGSIMFATSMVENYEPIIDVLKVLVATYGTYRAALIATSALQFIPAAQLFIAEYMAMGKALGFATANQIAFNGAILANPYAIAAAAIVGLIFAVALFRDTTTEAEKAQDRIANVSDKVSESMAGEMAKIQLLTSTIKNENVSRDEKSKKLNELISLHPQMLKGITLENIATEEGTKAINGYIEARKRQIEVEQLNLELTDSIKRQIDAKNGKNETGFLSDLGTSLATMGSGFTAGTKGTDFVKVQASERKKLNAEIFEDEKALQKSILDRVTALQTADSAANKSADNTVAAVRKTVAAYDEEIKSKKEAQEKSSSNTQYNALQKEIDALEKARDRITGGKKTKVADKDLPQPFGSIAYYEQIARKADEIISKTPGTNTSEIAKQNKIKIDAEVKADAIRKQSAIKTFEQELEEKKRAYELYQRWIDAYGKESADQQFKSLISSNKDYVSYLDGEIRKLESIKNFTPLNKKDEENLLNLQSERTQAIGGPSRVDQYKESLDQAKESAESLTEYIGFLKQAQDSLSAAAPTTDVIAQRKITAEAKLEAEKQRQELLKDFLLNTEDSEEKRLETERHYAELRNALEERSLGEKTASYQKALAAINQAESEENKQRKERVREASQEYKALVKAVEDAANSSGLFDQINKQKDLVASLLASEGYSDKFMQEQKTLADMQKALYMQIAGAVGELGNALEGIGGTMGQIGSALSGIASQANGVITVFDKNATATQKWGAAAQGVSNIIGIISSSARQRKDAETAYYASVISQQSQYNILLNTAIGMQSELNGNVFVTDYEGKITDGIKMMANAQAGYEKSLEALENGRAKIGQRNAVDWGKVGSGAASGAAIGAAVGGPFAVITGAIGAVIGGIVGLFAGKKKKDQFGGLLEVFPELIDQSGAFNKKLADTLIANNLVDDSTKALLQDTIAWTDQLEKAKDQIESVIVDLAGGLGDGLRDELVGAFEQGTSAAQAWGSGVSKILKDLISQTLFSKLFAADFEKLQAEMEASYGLQGDQNFVDDIIRFYDTAGTKAQSYIDALAAAQAEGEKYGLDLFDKAVGKGADPLSGSIKGMSEETASVLAGQVNAIRITNADIGQSMRQMLIYQANISRNSDYMKHLLYLADVVDQIKKLNQTSLRGFGL